MARPRGNDSGVYGVMAEFESVESLMAAAAGVREAGYTRWDCHTPFPVHGLDDVMGVRPTRLPWIVLLFGALGVTAALGMQYWMNGVDYAFIISGKPRWSLPANIPVIFEVTVLFSAFTSFFAMWIMNDLPRWFHPLFRKERFARATNDRFFVVIEARDPQFHAERTAVFLEGLGAAAVETVEMPGDKPGLPSGVKRLVVVTSFAALVPPAMLYNARHATSEEPPVNLVPDMDDQPRFRPQGSTTLFADGRMTRPPVPGTVARGALAADAAWHTGKEGDDFIAGFPAALEVTPELIERGRQRYGIYCAPCHGHNGLGQGTVSQAALRLAFTGQAAWVQPTSVNDPRLVEMASGEIFQTITEGKNTMPGYAAQISTEDRWAIVGYVRALQRAQPPQDTGEAGEDGQ